MNATHVDGVPSLPAIREALLDRLGPDLAHRDIGGRPLFERLLKAIDEGRLEYTDDERLALKVEKYERHSAWIAYTPAGVPLRGHIARCQFFYPFLFQAVYGESLLPVGCRRCYKVKVQVSSLAELIQVRALSKKIACTSKCGSELNQPHTQTVWSAFLYADGLEMAFELHHRIRGLIDGHPRLGTAVKTFIKRGCTGYEMAFGPSDQWRFDDSLAELERALLDLFAPPTGSKPDNLSTYLGWIATAFRIGDDSYLELTGGKRLYPETVNYLDRF